MTLVSFVAGDVGGARRAAVIEHLDTCEDCMTEVTLAMRAHGQPVRRLRWRPLAAIAAAVVIAVTALLLWQRTFAPPMSRLVAAAPRSARVVEPRLTGGFAWAVYRGETRTNRGAMTAEEMQVAGAAGEIVKRAERDRSAATQHAAGVARMLVRDPLGAIRVLEPLARATNDAKAWTDLAAAKYAAAADLQRPALYPEALAAADRALRADPVLAEALFNRALILERMRLVGEARRAWMRYLEIDPSSPWAVEARARLTQLPAAPASSRFESERPALERAAARGDLESVQRIVAAHPDRSRAWAETEYLGDWGEAVLRGDHTAAARFLTMARTIGGALVNTTGESLLRDSVACIDRARDRRALAEGHAAYRSARHAYHRDRIGSAREELLRAARLLQAAADPLALMARYYASGARLASNDAAGARADLREILNDAERHRGYLALRAHVRWELSRTFLLDDDPSGALPLLSEGVSLFRAAGDRAGEAFLEGMLAASLASAGRGDDGWSARIRAFDALAADGDVDVLRTSLRGATMVELRSGRRDSALALARLEVPTLQGGARAIDVIDALVHRAMLEAASGNAAEAAAAAHEAASVAAAIRDDALRARMEAEVAVATAAARAERDPREAIEPLTRAIDFYRAHDLAIALPEPLLLRARCAARTGNAAAAARDLEEGMAAVERAAPRESSFDAARALFEDAIRLALDRRDPAAAFALAERSRRQRLSVAQLQHRLAGSGTAVLALTALPDELVVFAVDERRFSAARRARPREQWPSLAEEIFSERSTGVAATLYDDIIRPADPVVRTASRLIVVADPPLQSIPFAALHDGSAYLVERMPVAIAASAAVLERQPAPARERVLAATSVETLGIPAADDELEEVAALYARTAALPRAGASFAALSRAGADVLHIAGHTERLAGAGEHALRFGGGERVSWKTIAATPLPRAEVVVLAACDTLRGPDSSLTRAPSLGGAFSAAGAADVVGTLMPIRDRDARELFRAIHRELAAGSGAAEAVRHAQRQAIRGGGPGGWRTIAVLTRSIL